MTTPYQDELGRALMVRFSGPQRLDLLTEAIGVLDDIVDRWERNDDPADWPGEIRSAYDFLRRIGKR